MFQKSGHAEVETLFHTGNPITQLCLVGGLEDTQLTKTVRNGAEKTSSLPEMLCSVDKGTCSRSHDRTGLLDLKGEGG